MKRLVVVSNRLPAAPETRRSEARDLPVGGLERAIHAALKRAPSALWFGWNGDQSADGETAPLTRRSLGGVPIVGMPLTPAELDLYYRGAANSALWPLCHSFQGRVLLDAEEFDSYARVNERFARRLSRLLRPGDVAWIHDYQLLRVGASLRRLGWAGPLGFFLHVPFPGADLWEIAPDARGLLMALLAHDVIGFQTEDHVENYVLACRRLLNARWRPPRLTAAGRTQRVHAFPVGIDPEPFLAVSHASLARHSSLERVVRGRKLVFGADRLDYTKGIPERILAFQHLVKSRPALRNAVSFVQVAAPSRGQVRHYADLARSVEALVGRVNGELAEHDWVPIRYLHRSYRPEILATFYRDAHVGLVTPLRDGMNLVAKEFVASQDPESPGVLVLSRFAGAARELDEALLVNPYMPSDVADAMAAALSMPLEERRRRHERLLERVLKQTASKWTSDFVAALAPETRPKPRRHRP